MRNRKAGTKQVTVHKTNLHHPMTRASTCTHTHLHTHAHLQFSVRKASSWKRPAAGIPSKALGSSSRAQGKHANKVLATLVASRLRAKGDETRNRRGHMQRTVRTANVSHTAATCPVMAPMMGPTQARDRGGGEGEEGRQGGEGGGEEGCSTSLVRRKAYTNSRPHIPAKMGKSDLLQGRRDLQTHTTSTCAWASTSSSVPWSWRGGRACGDREAGVGNGGAGACGRGSGSGAGERDVGQDSEQSARRSHGAGNRGEVDKGGGSRHDVDNQRHLPNKDPRSYNDAQKAVLEAHYQTAETRISIHTAQELARQIDCLDRGRQADESDVKVWFMNRRKREKNLKLNHCSASASVTRPSEGRWRLGGVGGGGSGGLRLGGVGGRLEPSVDNGVQVIDTEERQRLASKLWGFVQDVLRQLHKVQYCTLQADAQRCGCRAAGPDAAVLSWAIESEVLHRDFLDAVLASDQSLQRWIEQFAEASQIGVLEICNTRLAVAWSTLLLLLPRDALPYNPPPTAAL